MGDVPRKWAIVIRGGYGQREFEFHVSCPLGISPEKKARRACPTACVWYGYAQATKHAARECSCLEGWVIYVWGGHVCQESSACCGRRGPCWFSLFVGNRGNSKATTTAGISCRETRRGWLPVRVGSAYANRTARRDCRKYLHCSRHSLPYICGRRDERPELQPSPS